MNRFLLKISGICPALSCLFSWIVIAVTIAISHELSPSFIYFSAQVYLNWYSVSRISRACVAISSNVDDVELESTSSYSHTIQIRGNRDPPVYESTKINKVWYCDKCTKHTSRPTRHCTLCKKCFHHRDHHCFFVGSCIIRENMGNFIMICIYASLSSIYSLSILGPYLFDHLDHLDRNESGVLDIVLGFSLPVALARFLFSGKDSCIILVTLFDVLFSVSCICLAFGFWKLYACLAGRQRYHPHVAKRYSFAEIFGRHGLWNVIFPIDGLFKTKILNEQYSCKEI